HAGRRGAPGAGRRARGPRAAEQPRVTLEARDPATRPDVGDDDLLAWRREFPTLETTLHFISHSLGAMPRGVEESLRQYAQTWKTRGIRAWEESWMALPTEVGNLLAGILGAEPGTVSMCENVTTAQAVA